METEVTVVRIYLSEADHGHRKSLMQEIVNILQDQALDLSWLVRPGTVTSALMTGMFGIQPRPTVIEVLGWLLFFVPVALFVAWPTKRASRRQVALHSSPAR